MLQVFSANLCMHVTIHLEAVYRILCDLKRSPGAGLLYTTQIALCVEAYTDADYAGFVCDRQLTSSYCTFVRGNLITWHSKKQ